MNDPNTYGMVRGNSRRAPPACELALPLRDVWNANVPYSGKCVFAPVLAHDDLVLVTGRERRTVALNAASQKRVWAHPAALRVVHRGRAFLWPDDDGLLVVDAHSGRPERTMLCHPCEDALAVGEYLVGWGPDLEYGGQLLWALDWDSGQRLWTQYFGEDIKNSGWLCATEDVLVYCTYDRRKGATPEVDLVACHISTGVELWRRQSAWLDTGGAIWNDRILAQSGNGVVALSLQDGKQFWERECGAGYLCGDTYHCFQYGEYVAFDAASGEQIVARNLEESLPKTLSGVRPSRIVLVTQTHIFAASDRNALLAFTRDGGEYAWHHHPKRADMAGEVVCSAGRLYYKNGFDRLYCLESATLR